MNNILKLKESKFISFLKDKLMPKSIVLFGSYQKREDIENSDIDLFIECKEEKLDLSNFILISSTKSFSLKRYNIEYTVAKEIAGAFSLISQYISSAVRCLPLFKSSL